MNGLLRPSPGEGLLARYDQLVLLCQAGPQHRERADSIAAGVAAVAADNGDGRHLSRYLSAVIGAVRPDMDFPSLCGFGPTEDGIAVVVHGDSAVMVRTGEDEVELDGRSAVTYLDRIVAGRPTLISARLGMTPTSQRVDPWSRLDQGVVRAAALVYDPEAVVPRQRQETTVLGIGCKNGHFNDPTVLYCVACGISMAQGTGRPRPDTVPPLGVLVLGDGTVLPMTKPYMFGNARIAPDGWKVTITVLEPEGATLLRPADKAWTPLRPHRTVEVAPGTRVRLGDDVQFSYESPRSY